MNKKQVLAMAESANFLFEHGISRNFFWEVLNESYKAHHWMEEKLGLTEKNNFRVIIQIPETDVNNSSDPFILFAKTICEIKTISPEKKWTVVDKAFVQDATKNKYKITRLLNVELWKKLVKCESEHGLELFEMCGFKTCCADCTLFGNSHIADEFVRKFSIWYGEQIKGNMHIVLSSHPLDILRASENASFTSCYRPDGVYFNGVISSMLSSDTLIASVEEKSRPGYKIGRSWVYVNETQIITARKYGNITDFHHLHIRSYLYSQMGGSWKHYPKALIDDGRVEMQGPGYLDKGFGSTSIRKNVTSENVVKINLPKAICLYCGAKYNNYQKLGICLKCAETISSSDLVEE